MEFKMELFRTISVARQHLWNILGHPSIMRMNGWIKRRRCMYQFITPISHANKMELKRNGRRIKKRAARLLVRLHDELSTSTSLCDTAKRSDAAGITQYWMDCGKRTSISFIFKYN